MQQEAAAPAGASAPAGQRREQVIYAVTIAVIVLGLYSSSRYSYILFHGLVELASIAIGFTLFIITWNARTFLPSTTFKILGIGYAFIAGIDLLHTLAYKGMSVFSGYGANLPTQLWIVARYLQAATLCVAPLLLRRKVGDYFLAGIYAAVVTLLVALVYTGLFPDCFIEGKGLTPFKIGSEYLIVAILGGALALFHTVRAAFNPRVYMLLVASIVCTALSELAFTAYLSVYGFANLLGHLLKLAAFYLIYRALLVTGFKEPYQLIFRELKEAYDRLGEVNVNLELEIEERRTAEDELRDARNDLEVRVTERTVELRNANERLRQELAERRQVEAALQASEARFRRLAENAPDVIYRMSLPDGRYEYVSPAAKELFGYAPEEFYASNQLIRHVMHPQWQDYFAGQWEALLQGAMPPTYEYKILHKSGEERWMHQRNILIRDDSGTIVAIEGIVTDITDRKILEEELCRLNEELEQRVNERTVDLKRKSEELTKSQQALLNIVEDLNQKTGELEEVNARLQELDRLKSLFIASMSHELRTPLNSIIGFSSVILNEWLGPVNGEQKENLAIILRCGKHLLNLINDVIDVSKIEAGKIDAATDDFALDELIAEAVSLVKQDLDEKGLALRVEAVNQPMHTDRRRLLQCVLNLLSNAVKFTEQGMVCVEARIRTASADGSPATLAVICVTDTGIGISEEDLPRMFQPFVRLVAPAQATTPGTGLGLYLTRKLAIEVLHGDILLESEYRKGSRFTIELPVRLS